jgi:sensor histidine kinase YesM
MHQIFNLLKIDKKIFYHFAVWLAYGIFMYFTNLLTKPDATLGRVLLYMVPFVITFYLSVICLNLYQEKGVIWSIASFFIVFFVMASFGYLYIYFFLPSFKVIVFSTTEFKPFLQGALSGYVRYFSFALLYFYIGKVAKNKQALHKIEQDRLTTEKAKLQYEYAFLRSQINPHFLHNTLNTLFSQALKLSPVLAENILKLSSLMRYSMEALEFESGKVSVKKELDHLQTLVDVYQLRFEGMAPILFEVEGDLNNQMVPPLSFITIAENAFKYGDLSSTTSPVVLRVVLQSEEVYFTATNKINENPLAVSSSNIGMSNLAKRLDISFKNKYSMSNRMEDGHYFFELRISSN